MIAGSGASRPLTNGTMSADLRVAASRAFELDLQRRVRARIRLGAAMEALERGLRAFVVH